MNGENQKDNGQVSTFDVIMIIMILIVFFAPAQVIVSPWGTWIGAMTWSFDTQGNAFDFGLIIFLASLPFMFLRIVFIVPFYRLYHRKAKQRHVIASGILAEIMFEIIFAIPLIISTIIFLPIAIHWAFPVPLLFGIGYLYLKFVPPPEESVWIEEEDPNRWWESRTGENQSD